MHQLILTTISKFNSVSGPSTYPISSHHTLPKLSNLTQPDYPTYPNVSILKGDPNLHLHYIVDGIVAVFVLFYIVLYL